MTPFAIWIYRLPFIIFLASAVLLLVGSILKWNADLPSGAAPGQGKRPEGPADTTTAKKKPKKGDWRAAIHTFTRRHTWTLILAAVLAAFLIFLLLTAPPRLTGKIPTTPGQPGSPFYSLRWLRSTLSTNYVLFWERVERSQRRE